ncbi:low molecular weight protein-tyrosine-phosphatase [Hasllibacter sp. MH4015]|uniref:low molecular weight protein-tyrosine-phosphatase n=1 Tax=Hasllibacter sp. MH4015 TaxID=2854029 RepID=UPI001CD64EA3|nr:low molecular weight protein-tyrosine-phosphatase [Hasllibacter sp. MH4015]
MTHSIFVVCLGNICRSPTAEAVLRAHFPDLRIDSAGTGDWHVGKPPYPPAIEAASARGYNLSDQRARQITRADFNDFDLILAMDESNLVDLREIAPDNARIELFRAPMGGGAVPDPYYTGDFDGALDLIEEAAAAWAKALTAP